MLLFLSKHSRPDIANTVRELTKVLDGASPAAFKELKRVIKYVLDTENLALTIHPRVENGNGKWSMVIYSGSDYATAGSRNHIVRVRFCFVPVWSTDSMEN
jgi:hypothetical protein